MARYKDPHAPAAQHRARCGRRSPWCCRRPSPMLVVIGLLHANTWNVYLFLVVLIAVAVARRLGHGQGCSACI